MAFGVDDAIAIGGGIAGGVGNAIGGNQGAKAQNDATRSSMQVNQQQLMAQIAQWRRQQALTEGNAAQQTQNHMQQNPMRDKLYAAMMTRMGGPQQSVTYGAGANGPVGHPNANPAANFNAGMAQYRPGMGGVSSGVDQQVLNNLGYGNNGTPDMYHNDPQAWGTNQNQWLSNYLAQMLGNNPQSIGSMPGNPATQPQQPQAPLQSAGQIFNRPVSRGAAPGGVRY